MLLSETPAMLQQADLNILNRNKISYDVKVKANEIDLKNNSKTEWQITIKTKEKTEQILLTKRGEFRIFKSLEAVFNFLYENCTQAKSITIDTRGRLNKQIEVD